MLSSVNKVILIGFLGRDPEVKSIGSGKRVANLSVATTKKWRSKTTGELVEHTNWHRVCVFIDGAVKFADDYLKKGSLVYVEGELRTRKYAAPDGTDRYITEVIIANYEDKLHGLDRPGNGGRADSTDAAPYPSLAEELDDEIPF